jgi:Ca2+-binding EF-hand superfamily protein
VTRLDLRCVEENRPDRFGGFLQQQLLVQLKQADSNGDGVIDENEAKTSRAFRGLFTMVDRDGDGKVTEKELTAYLDHLRELQTRAVAGCVTLVLTDQSRGLFDLLDANRDGRLSVREMRQAPELLKALDRDGKGYLTQADIPHSYRVALRRGPAEQGGNPAALAALYLGGDQARAEPEPTAGPAWFRKMDRNRDGDVSRREFLFSDEMFRRLDRDGDGLISREEAEKADTPASPQKGNDR